MLVLTRTLIAALRYIVPSRAAIEAIERELSATDKLELYIASLVEIRS